MKRFSGRSRSEFHRLVTFNPKYKETANAEIVPFQRPILASLARHRSGLLLVFFYFLFRIMRIHRYGMSPLQLVSKIASFKTLLQIASTAVSLEVTNYRYPMNLPTKASFELFFESNL